QTHRPTERAGAAASKATLDHPAAPRTQDARTGPRGAEERGQPQNRHDGRDRRDDVAELVPVDERQDAVERLVACLDAPGQAALAVVQELHAHVQLLALANERSSNGVGGSLALAIDQRDLLHESLLRRPGRAE